MNNVGERTLRSDNGSSTLKDRVRSLRLAERNGGRGRASRGGVLSWSLCVILLMTTAAFGYRAYRVAPAVVSPTTAEAPRVEAPAPTTASADTPTTVASSGDVVLQQKGYVIPVHQVQVSPKVGGMIIWIDPRFEEGQFFKKGDVLARLEDVDYKAERDHARQALAAAIQRRKEMDQNRDEEIEQAKKDLEESKATREQMMLDLNRNRKLIGTAAVSQSDYERAKFGYDAMARRVEKLKAAYELMCKGQRDEKKAAADADIKAAEADLEKAEWRLGNCLIKAPISGTVLSKKAEEGNIVNPAAYSSGISASLCDMADLRDLEIDLTVQERDIAQVEKNQRCFVMPEAFQNHKPFLKGHPKGYPGHVSRLMPIADRSKGAVPVRVRIKREDIPEEEAGVFLKPDMGVLVSFLKTDKSKE
jgi:multidrug resistance efflux pump